MSPEPHEQLKNGSEGENGVGLLKNHLSDKARLQYPPGNLIFTVKVRLLVDLPYTCGARRRGEIADREQLWVHAISWGGDDAADGGYGDHYNDNDHGHDHDQDDVRMMNNEGCIDDYGDFDDDDDYVVMPRLMKLAKIAVRSNVGGWCMMVLF